MSLSSLLFFSLSLGTWTQTTAGPAQPPGHARLQERDQRICYLLTDSDAKNITVIYTRDDKKLYIREGRSLPDCSSVFGLVELDNCSVCVREEQVMAECRLTDPSAKLNFEARGKSLPLKKIKTQCDTSPALNLSLSPGPAASEDLGVGVTVPGPAAPEGLGERVIVMIVLGVLGAAAAVFSIFILAKMRSRYHSGL